MSAGPTIVIGAHGQIGRILVRKLAARGQPVRAMIRDEGQRPEMEALGAEVVVGDLEEEFADALLGCSAAIFTAGSGGHTGADKTLLVDLWGAIRSYDACRRGGIRRYLMVSALRADDPTNGPERIRHYLVAKRVADDALQRSGLDFTIVRPGQLTNDPGTGRVATAAQGAASVAREDVADALVACLAADGTIGKVFDLVDGDTPIDEAIASL